MVSGGPEPLSKTDEESDLPRVKIMDDWVFDLVQGASPVGIYESHSTLGSFLVE